MMTGSGNPMEKPKRTPAFADIAAAPTSTAVRNNLVFISFNFLMFFTEAAALAAWPH
jgi:hypothetical protein